MKLLEPVRKIPMNASLSVHRQFLECAAFEDFAGMQALAKQCEKQGIPLDMTERDADGSISRAVGEKGKLKKWMTYQYKEMTALHFACLAGNTAIIRYLIIKAPSLLQLQDSEGETPLLSLVRKSRLIQGPVSGRIFTELFLAGAAFDVVNKGKNNIFHFLGETEGNFMLQSVLKVFKIRQWLLTNHSTPLIPDLVNVVADYMGLYSSETKKRLLNAPNFLQTTPWQIADKSIKPILAAAGAKGNEHLSDIEARVRKTFPLEEAFPDSSDLPSLSS